jgi:hypothetical protein
MYFGKERKCATATGTATHERVTEFIAVFENIEQKLFMDIFFSWPELYDDVLTKFRVVNFATSKSLIVKSTMFVHCNIHKFTWTSPDGKTHIQIDHILIDRRRHSSIFYVQSFRAAGCDMWWW